MQHTNLPMHVDTIFYTCFRFRFIDTYVLTWSHIYYWFSDFSFMFLVIACTCMPKSHHLIMYTCDCLSTPTGFILRTRWVTFWQPWTLISRFRSLNYGGLAVPDQSAQRMRGSTVACSDPPFSNFPLIGSRDSYPTTHEYSSHLLYCTSCFYTSWWYYILELLYHALW